jgi:hypothetical protein
LTSKERLSTTNRFLTWVFSIKTFATAKDNNGWFHIDKQGNEVYKNRYLTIEPFYNGFALVTTFDNEKNNYRRKRTENINGLTTKQRERLKSPAYANCKPLKIELSTSYYNPKISKSIAT